MSAPKRVHLDDDAHVEAGDLEDTDELHALLTAADAIQAQLEQLNDEATDKVLAIETEYNQKRRPHYEQRAAILSSVPFFWRDVLLAHSVLSDYFTTADQEVLEYVTDVRVTDDADPKIGYSICMTFSPDNPYFSNRELLKQLRFSEDGHLTVLGTDIHWAPGQGPRPEGAPVVGAKRHATFDYDFFGSWWEAQGEGEGEGGPEEGDPWADTFKDDVWPDPVRWYRERQQQLLAVDVYDDEGGAAGHEYNGGGYLEEEEGEEEEEEEEGEAGLQQEYEQYVPEGQGGEGYYPTAPDYLGDYAAAGREYALAGEQGGEEEEGEEQEEEEGEEEV